MHNHHPDSGGGGTDTMTQPEVNNLVQTLFIESGNCSQSNDPTIKAEAVDAGATEDQAQIAIDVFHFAFDDHCQPILPP